MYFHEGSSESFGIQNDHLWQSHAALSHGVDDLRHYETLSNYSPDLLPSKEESPCSPEFLGFSPSSSISLSQSTVLDKRKTGGNYYERGHGEIHAKVAVWNITSTIHENEKTLLADILDTTKLVETGDQLIIKEPVEKCVLPKELKIIPDQSISSHTVLTDQCNAILSNEDPITHAIGAGFSLSDRESIFTSWHETDTSEDILTLLNSCSADMNAEMVKCPIPQVTESLSSDKEIISASRQNVKKSHQVMDHSGNYDKAEVCTLPTGSQGSIQELSSKEGSIQEPSSKEGSTVQKPDSNALKRKRRCKRTGIVSNTDGKNVGGTSSDNPTVMGTCEVNSLCKTVKRIKIPEDSTVLYLPPGGSEVKTEPELILCLSPKSEILYENYQVVVDIPCSKDSKRIPSKGARPLGQMKKPGAPRVIHSNLLHKNEGKAPDSVKDRTLELNNRSPCQVDEIGNGQNSLGDKIATLTSLDVNPDQQVNGEQTVSDILKRSCRTDSKKTDKFIKAHKSSSGVPNQQMNNQNHGKQHVDGIFSGDNNRFNQMGKTVQAVEHIALNTDKPSDVDEKSSGLFTTQLSPQAVCSDSNLEYFMNTESKMRSVCSSDCFNEDEERNDSVPPLKTVSTTHPSQLMDIERVVENISPARLMNKSAKVSEKLAESTVGAVKGQNIADLSSRDKLPHQPDNPDATVKRCLPLEDKQLDEANRNETVSDGASATNDLQTVRCPFNVNEKFSMTTSTSLLCQQVNGEQTLSDILKRTCRIDNKEAGKFIKAHKPSIGVSNRQMNNQSHEQQVVECKFPSACLMEDENKKRVDGFVSGDNGRFYHQGKTIQAVKHIPLNTDKPSNIDKKSSGSASTQVSPQGVCSDSMLEYLMNSEPKTRSVCSSDWLNVKTVSTTHSSQLMDIERVVENIPSASLMSKSTRVSGQLVESVVGAVKGLNLADLTPRDKLPQQPDNPDATVKRCLLLEGTQLHEANRNGTNSDGASATNDLQTVRCPSNVNEKFAMSTSTSVLCHQVNGEQTVSDILKRSCGIDSRKAEKFIKAHKSSSGVPNRQINNQNHGQQVVECTLPSACLIEDENKKRVDGIVSGDNSRFHQQGKTIQAVEHIPLNTDKPSNVDEKSGGSASTQVSPQGVCSDGKLEYSMNSEPKTRSVCSSDWFNEDEEGKDSVPPLKNVSTTHSSQLMDIERVVENISPARLMSRSTKVSGKLAESTVDAVKGQHIADSSPQDKLPHQPDNPDATVKRCLPLEGKQLYETNRNETDSDGASATYDLQTVRCPSNVNEKFAISISTSLLCQQVNCKPTVSDILKRSCGIDSKEADKFIKTHKSSSGVPNRQINNQNHGQQVVKCTFPSACLMDKNKKRVDGIVSGDNGRFHQQGKTIQAVKHIPLNTDKPSYVDEKSGGSASTQVSPQGVCSNGKLEYLMNSEPKTRSVCSSDWFNEDEEGKDSVPPLKNVSTTHSSQLMDIERVVENISPATLMSKSTKVSGKLAESTVDAVKCQNIADLSPPDKLPQQPDNPDATVKRCLPLEDKQLHEKNRNETDSDGASATNDLQTVRCPSNVNEKLAVCTSVLCQQVNGEQTVSDILKRSCGIDSKKAGKFIKAHKSSSGVPNRKMNNYNHGQQIVKCTFPSPCLMEDGNKKLIVSGDNGLFYHQGKTIQAVEHIPLNTDRPSNVDEKPGGSVSTQVSLQAVCFDSKLEYLMNSEPKTRSVCSSDWFNEDEEGKDSVPPLKTVFTTHPSQLMDIERVVENISPARLMSKSTKVSGQLVESVVGAVKGLNLADLTPRDKRPHQPDNPDATVKRCLSLEGKQLHEANRYETDSDGASATNDLQTVRSNINEKFAMTTSTITQLSPQTICSGGNLENLVDSEPTVRFVWSSDLFNEDKERMDYVPSVITDPTRQQEGKQLHETNASKTSLDGTGATNVLQTVRCIFPADKKSSSSEFSSQNVLQNLSEADMIPEPSMPETRCMLPCDKQDEDDVQHIEQCGTIAYALDLRIKQSSMFRSLPIESNALDLVNKIIGSACKQYLLNNLCTNDDCILVHNVQLNFGLPEHDFKISFNMFSRWYLSNSKQPNLKVLLLLLSLLSRDFGDELLITILFFSTALFQVAHNFRRPLGIKLIEKLVHLVDFTKKNAIRTIIIFNLTQDTEEAIITDLLQSLGVYEEDMTNLYESISCIWHINGNYSFSQNVLFAMLKECLQEMPPEFGDTKNKIIDELLKYPRSVLNKHFHVIERFLLKYYALNSLAAHKVRCLVLYGKIPEPDDLTRKKSYQSSRVKSTGPINWNLEYLDINEERQKSFELVMCKMVQDEDQTEDVCGPVEFSTAPDFKMEELLDSTDIGDNLKLLTTLSNDSTIDSSKYVSRMEKALKRRKYKRLYHIVMKSAERKSLDTYMNELYDMLTRLDKDELPRTIYECLKQMPLSKFHKTHSLVRNKFTIIINSLVLMFYKNRDFKSALKLLKTLRMSGVNPLGFPPDEIDEQGFTVVCSDIHFECRSMLEALRILLYKDCLNYVKYNCMPMLSNHFRLLERLVVKMLKCFVTKRLPSLAMILFRALFHAQKDLFFPIDIGKYYELVLSNSFITCKASCAPHDGANLFILVQRSCRQEEILRSTTYRSLIVELVRVKAPDDILRRILQLCLHYRVYPAFTLSSITLGTHLLVEEMYIYLLHCFQYLLDQHRPAFLQRNCTVQLVPTPKPLRKPCPFLEDLKKVETEIPHAAERFEEALRRIVGPVIYPDLSLSFPSPSEIVIPPVGMEALAEIVLGDRL